MLGRVYLNQLGTSYWHGLSYPGLSYEGSSGAPRHSEKSALSSLRKRWRREGLLLQIKIHHVRNRSKRGNVKRQLGDEKGNRYPWCTLTGVCICGCIRTQVYTCPRTANLLYVLSIKPSLLFYQPGVRPESMAPSTLNAQSLYSAARYSQSFTCLTTASSCWSHFFPRTSAPHH